MYTKTLCYAKEGAQTRCDANAIELKSGQRGTKKPMAQYGQWLVCVRYRYDEKKRYKTVELIVEEVD